MHDVARSNDLRPCLAHLCGVAAGTYGTPLRLAHTTTPFQLLLPAPAANYDTNEELPVPSEFLWGF